LTPFFKLRTMNNEKKIKKYGLRYEYLVLELQEVQEQLVEYKTQFNLYIIELEKQHDIQIFNRAHMDKPHTKVRETDDHDNVVIDKKRDNSQDQVFKDLYGQIARRTHPDKTGDDPDMSRMFRHATKAKNENDLMTIMKMCDTLDIPVPELGDNHIKTLEKSIKKIQDKINGLKNQDAYVWGVADGKIRSRIEANILKTFKK